MCQPHDVRAPLCPRGTEDPGCTVCLFKYIGSRFVVPTVAASVDLIVHIALGPDGVRRVEEIVAVPGRVEADICTHSAPLSLT